MLRLPELMLGSLGGIQLMIVAAIFGTCTLAAVVIATGFGTTIRRTSSSTSAGPKKPPAPRTTKRADLDLAGWLVHGL